VGAYAGAEIMKGLLHVRMPLLLRRFITILPALVILVIGVDPTLALVLSQVVLSFGIPFALIPLVRLTMNKELLGDAVNALPTTITASIAALLLITLNVTLLWLIFTGA
jgi:manganese transport protein